MKAAEASVLDRCLLEIVETLLDDDKAPVEANDSLPFTPHPGPQEEFVRSNVDVVVYGGGAAGGKTAGLIMAPARYAHVRNYDAILFRRNMTDALAPGALWQETFNFYPQMGAKANSGRHKWHFPDGAKVTVAHLDRLETVYNYQGAQVSFVGFDELTHFEESQFWYLFSRVRSATGAPSAIRATCNPDPDSFVADLVAWYIDQETGLADVDRAGVVRWFIRTGTGELVWGDTRAELETKYPAEGKPSSFTFIPASLEDNPTILKKDPGYPDRLKRLPFVERERLLGGNWKVKQSGGVVFRREWFKHAIKIPDAVELEAAVRYWDNAGSTGGRADRTAGVLMARGTDGRFYILDCIAFREEAPERERIRRQVAERDGSDVHIWVEQEPGSSGKDMARAIVGSLAGYVVKADRVTGPKVTRWAPLASQAEAENVVLVAAPGERWAKEFVDELHNSDGSDRVHDDRTDAAAGAFSKLALVREIGFL